MWDKSRPGRSASLVSASSPSFWRRRKGRNWHKTCYGRRGGPGEQYGGGSVATGRRPIERLMVARHRSRQRQLEGLCCAIERVVPASRTRRQYKKSWQGTSRREFVMMVKRINWGSSGSDILGCDTYGGSSRMNHPMALDAPRWWWFVRTYDRELRNGGLRGLQLRFLYRITRLKLKYQPNDWRPWGGDVKHMLFIIIKSFF